MSEIEAFEFDLFHSYLQGSKKAPGLFWRGMSPPQGCNAWLALASIMGSNVVVVFKNDIIIKGKGRKLLSNDEHLVMIMTKPRG